MGKNYPNTIVDIFTPNEDFAIDIFNSKYEKDDSFEETMYCFYSVPLNVENFIAEYNGEFKFEIRESESGKMLHPKF